MPFVPVSRYGSACAVPSRDESEPRAPLGAPPPSAHSGNGVCRTGHGEGTPWTRDCGANTVSEAEPLLGDGTLVRQHGLVSGSRTLQKQPPENLLPATPTSLNPLAAPTLVKSRSPPPSQAPSPGLPAGQTDVRSKSGEGRRSAWSGQEVAPRSHRSVVRCTRADGLAMSIGTGLSLLALVGLPPPAPWPQKRNSAVQK